jgi:predicted transcriptional regulator
MTKQEIELRKGYAFRLFMSGEPQKSIAATVGISETTVSKWAIKENWQTQREAQNTSTQELSNSLMAAAKRMTDQIVKLTTKDDVDIKLLAQCTDNLCKIMASAERINKSVTKATIIDVIIALDRWLANRKQFDKDLTDEQFKFITNYHQKYIEELTINS